MINTLQNSMAQAKELVEAMDEQIKMYDGIIDSMIANHGFTPKLRSVLSQLSKEAIDSLDSTKVDRIIEFTQSQLTDINAAKDEDTDEKKAMTFSEYCINVFKEIYDCCVNYADAVNEKEKLDKEIREITNKSYDASTSSKARLEKVEALQKQLKDEPDPVKQAQIQKMLDTVRKTEDLSFLTERIVKIGDNEVRNIINTFFNAKRSSLIMDKFRIRIKRLGYDENTYKMFFNIEEMFLPEEYYPMNNIFLFVAMRYISYADTNNKNDALFCSSLLIKMYNLVYHRFSTPEEEKEFINQIKHVDDYFVPYTETLEEKNVTSPNHPARQEAHRENEARLRESLCNAIHEHGEELTDDVIKMSVPELKKYLESIVASEKVAKEGEIDRFVCEIDPTRAEENAANNEEVVNIDIGDGDSVEIPKKDESEEQIYSNEDLDKEEEDNSVAFPDMKSAAESLQKDVDAEVSDYLNAEADTNTTTVTTNASDDDSMIIQRRGDVNVPMSFDMKGEYSYVDSYGDMYVPTTDHKAYDFYDSRDGHRVEQNVDEIVVLQLCSSGAVTKKIFSEGIMNPTRDNIHDFKFQA